MMDFMNYGAVKIPLDPPLEKGEFYNSPLYKRGAGGIFLSPSIFDYVVQKD